MSDPLIQRALTDSDAAAYAALNAAIVDAGGSDHREDEAAFRHNLNHPLGSPEFEDFQGLFDGERLVATGWVARQDVAEPVHWMHSDGGVHPDYLGRGIGTRLVRWQRECARRIHEHYFPGHQLDLQVRLAEHNEAARELFENEGYAQERWWFSMRRPAELALPQIPFPVGLELEPYTAAVSAELHHADNDAFSEHWHHAAMSMERWDNWMSQDSVRHELCFLLRDPANGEIAGFIISTAKEADYKATGVRDVHFAIIGTRAAYRGRGVASSLIGHALRESRKLGFEGATLSVDAENPSGALGVYERNGFACVRRVAVYIARLA